MLSPEGDRLGEQVSLRDDGDDRQDETCSDVCDLDLIIVTMMCHLHLPFESALKLNHVLKALPAASKGQVFEMPSVLLREFAHHVCQSDLLGDCMHVASIILKSLNDLYAEAVAGRIPREEYVFRALSVVTDDFEVKSCGMTQGVISELFAASSHIGPGGVVEGLRQLTEWLDRAERFARDTDGSLSSVLIEAMRKGRFDN